MDLRETEAVAAYRRYAAKVEGNPVDGSSESEKKFSTNSPLPFWGWVFKLDEVLPSNSVDVAYELIIGERVVGDGWMYRDQWESLKPILKLYGAVIEHADATAER